jgi:hypothetical protein
MAGYRHLATRVIFQAFRDVGNPNESSETRTSARVFLAGSGMLYYWCELAQINPREVVARARALGTALDGAATKPRCPLGRPGAETIRWH